MADPVREPLYTPNRVYPKRQAEPTQNGLQTFFAGTVAAPPYLNQDFSRPSTLVVRREDVAQQRFAFGAPFMAADLGRPKTLDRRRDDQIGSNELLFVAGVAPSVFIAQFDASGPARNLWTRADTPLGTPFKLLAQTVQTPVAQSDLSAKAQSPYRRVDIQLGSSYQARFPVRPFVRPDLSAPAPNRYRRVDGPLGSPLAIVFPVPISVLPHNVFDVVTRPMRLRVNGQDVVPMNLLVPGITPAPVVVETPRRRGRIIVDKVTRESIAPNVKREVIASPKRESVAPSKARNTLVRKKPRTIN